MSKRGAQRFAIWTLSAGLLVLGGCELDKVDIPELNGPAELALSLRLTAVPDVITADGYSTSVVQATLRDQNGRPVVGREVFFTITDPRNNAADIGGFQTANGPGTGAKMATNAQGTAQVVYQAPARTDFTADGVVLVQARPIADDFSGQLYRVVRIELQSAEPRIFPQGPTTNIVPTCNFVIEVPPGGSCSAPRVCTVRVNQVVGFQSTSTDSTDFLVRYEWFFGDGSPVEYAPDVAHVFRLTGVFTPVHRVTDNFGAQTVCSATITVVP